MIDTRLEATLVETEFAPADLRALRVLQQGAESGAWNRRVLFRWLAAPGVAARVLRERARPGPPVAFFVLHGPPPGETGDVYVANFGVARAWRRRGVGRFALGLVEEHARRRGARRIVLHVQETNLPAQCLYRSMGYVAVEIEHGGYGDQDAYRMVRELA